jgi:hypothetical protein
MRYVEMGRTTRLNLFKCDGKPPIPAGTGAMVASQFDWTTALMVLGLLVAMVCVFYTRA